MKNPCKSQISFYITYLAHTLNDGNFATFNAQPILKIWMCEFPKDSVSLNRLKCMSYIISISNIKYSKTENVK